jgi:type I restriction enzyme, R subunit
LANEILNAIIDAMAAHEKMSRQALDSTKVREGLRDVLLSLGRLYEELRKQQS